LPPPLDELPRTKMLLSLFALLSAALLARAAPPTCYSRVLSLSKEITESFKELQTSKAKVSQPKNSYKDIAGCLLLIQVAFKIKLLLIFLLFCRTHV